MVLEVCISVKMHPISTDIYGKHLTIDRIQSKNKFSLLKGCSFFDELYFQGNVYMTYFITRRDPEPSPLVVNVVR